MREHPFFGYGSGRMRIPIAEDEVEIARALKVLWEKTECSVDIVHNGKDAWDHISQGKFDVVVPGYYDAGNGRA